MGSGLGSLIGAFVESGKRPYPNPIDDPSFFQPSSDTPIPLDPRNPPLSFTKPYASYTSGGHGEPKMDIHYGPGTYAGFIVDEEVDIPSICQAMDVVLDGHHVTCRQEPVASVPCPVVLAPHGPWIWTVNKEWRGSSFDPWPVWYLFVGRSFVAHLYPGVSTHHFHRDEEAMAKLHVPVIDSYVASSDG